MKYIKTPIKAGKPQWFRGRHSENDGKIAITAGSDGVLGNVYGIGVAADFVHAVNSHDALIEAVKWLLSDNSEDARATARALLAKEEAHHG